ncbi:hypothetical protein ZWY2020_029782 [Hordeum vulgare]|nr:hypothetical protein ZWY2020_029782 [Hordeum vulgare]
MHSNLDPLYKRIPSWLKSKHCNNTTQIQIRKKPQHLLMAILGKSTSALCIIGLVLMATVLSSCASSPIPINECNVGPFPKENCPQLCHKACYGGVCLLGDDDKYYCCCEPVRQDGSMRPQEVAEMIQT